MAIEFSCTCGKKLKVNDEFAGRTGVCPGCGTAVAIPGGVATPPPLPLPQPAHAIQPPPLPQAVPAPARERVMTRPPEPAPADEELRNHGGGDIPANADFFVDPPADIGHLLSAHTTLTKEQEPWSLSSAVFLWMAFAAVGVLIGLFIVFLSRPRDLFWILPLPTGLGLVGFAIGFFCTRFSHTCNFVGRDGVARYTCRGDRGRVVQSEVFLFRDAVELRIGQTRHYTNGVYQNTTYTYTWTDVAKRKVFVIQGSHRYEKGNPPAKDAFHFALASELAWSMYLWNQSEAQITLGGKITFRLKGNDVIKIGPDYLKVDVRGQVDELSARDIGDARIDAGTFVIEAADAQKGWFSSTGVYKFPYHDLGNAQLFLFLMDKLLGIRVR